MRQNQLEFRKIIPCRCRLRRRFRQQRLSLSVRSVPPPPAPKLDYTIQGDNLQVIRIKLKPGQELFAEATAKMISTSSRKWWWETRMSGDTIGEKIWGARLKRKLMGEYNSFSHVLSLGGER